MTEKLAEMPSQRQGKLAPPVEYDRLLAAGPVLRARFPNGSTGWMVTRFDETRLALADPRLGVRDRLDHRIAGTPEEVEHVNRGVASLMGMDEPEHGALRRLTIGWFTPKKIKAMLQPYLETIVTEHLDLIDAGPKPADLITQLALPIPCLVICEMLGVPYRDRDEFHHASMTITKLETAPGVRDAAMTWLYEYITELIAEKRGCSTGNDLLAELARGAVDGKPIMTEAELVEFGVFLLVAGHATTTSMIGLSALTLLTHPRQRRQIVDEPAKVVPAVEELLRYLSIIHFGASRIAMEDLEIGGQHIAKGDLVVATIPSANVDPRKYRNPRDLDFDRPVGRHIAFGFGVHQCLGQNVVRAELRTVLPALFRRFPDLRLAVPFDKVPMETGSTHYAVQELPVIW